jgi:phage portal protein BeeE
MDFYRSAISPYLKTFESRMNFSFLGDSTREFKFDVSELIRGDFSGEVDAYKKLLEIGVMSPNEVRGRLDMNPRDGGDDFVSDSNNLTFGDEAEGTPDEPEQPEQTTEETEEISEELNE